MMITRQAVVLTGMTPNHDHLSAVVQVELRDDGHVYVFDGLGWRLLDRVSVHRVSQPELEALATNVVHLAKLAGNTPVDLGDDCDGDLDGYDGR